MLDTQRLIVRHRLLCIKHYIIIVSNFSLYFPNEIATNTSEMNIILNMQIK